MYSTPHREKRQSLYDLEWGHSQHFVMTPLTRRVRSRVLAAYPSYQGQARVFSSNLGKNAKRVRANSENVLLKSGVKLSWTVFPRPYYSASNMQQLLNPLRSHPDTVASVTPWFPNIYGSYAKIFNILVSQRQSLKFTTFAHLPVLVDNLALAQWQASGFATAPSSLSVRSVRTKDITPIIYIQSE